MSNPFPATYSILDPDALLTNVLQTHYDLPLTQCKLHSRGMNDTYWVGVDGARSQSGDADGVFYLRASRADWKSEEQIRYELAVLKHLADGEAPVAAPVPRRRESMAYSVDDLYVTIPAFEGNRYVALFHAASGRSAPWNPAERFSHYGRALARLHQVGDALPHFDHPETSLSPNAILDRSLSVLEPVLAPTRQADWSYLTDLADRLRHHPALTAKDGVDWGICHGDVMAFNACITEESKVTFYDFDCCGFGPRVYDLGVMRWAGWQRGVQEPPHWPHFLQGYQEIRPLSTVEVDAIPACVALRGIWIMWYHTRNAAHFGCSETDEGYFDKRIGYLRAWDEAWLTDKR